MQIFTTQYNGTLQTLLGAAGQEATRVRIAVAYFTSAEQIEQFAAKADCNISLVVLLKPPTSYEALKRVSWLENVEVCYLSADLHSKIYLFESENGKSAIVGSSNLTSGGLASNIETNVLLNDGEVDELGILNHFSFIAEQAEILTPDVLHKYKVTYEEWKKQNPSSPANKSKSVRKLKSDVAKDYVHFWNGVDHVHELLGELPGTLFSELPAYIAIDHFWHYLTSVCDESTVQQLLLAMGRGGAVKKLFADYAKWTINDQYTTQLPDSLSRIQTLLHPDKVSSLTIDEAVDVYRCLHCSQMPIQRFGRDIQFRSDNTIEQIREVFLSLVHGTEPIEFRIEDALTDKLRWFGNSAVQELNGWYWPHRFPIRNSKADDALKLLGIRSGLQ